MEKEADELTALDWAKSLPWGAGRAAVEAEIEYLAKVAARAGTLSGFQQAARLVEIRRRVAAWDAATYQQAESVALRGL